MTHQVLDQEFYGKFQYNKQKLKIINKLIKNFRRLSSKTKGNHMMSGFDNVGYQGEAPKSPWRYPFRKSRNDPPIRPPLGLQRTISQDSGSSFQSIPQSYPMHKPNLSRTLP